MHRLAVLLLAGAAAYAAGVSGHVYDPAGAVVPGVQVKLTHTETGAVQSGVTSAAGEYAFVSLVAGNYELFVAAPGFQAHRLNLKLDANTARSANVVLRLGEIQETLDVRTPGTPRPQAGPQRIRVGGNIQVSRLLRQPRPAYPEAARAEGREGTVILRAVISKEGAVNDVVSMTGTDPDLAAAAEAAVRQWMYQPTLLNGQPVEVITTVQVNFRLGG